MSIKTTIVEIIFLLAISHNGKAQTNDLKFNLVKGNNGKPLGKISAITQDPHGYVWLCGQEAKCIYRYDGNRFTSFRHDEANKNSLGLTSFETIYADNSGIIWIGGDELDEYNPATRTFKHYKPAGYVYSIVKDRRGRLWVGTANGLDYLDEKTGKFTHYRNEPGNPKSLSSNVVWRIYEDHQGTLWIATGYPFFKRDPEDGGLNRLNNDGSFTRYMHDPKDPHSLINNKVAAMFEDSHGTFWIGTGGDGLHTMDRETGRFERKLHDPKKPGLLSCPPLKQNEENDKITFITEDMTGAIWIGTMYSGINRYDTKTKKITHLENSNGFPDTKSWNTFTSKEGELWITTENANLFRVDPFYKPLTNIPINNLVSNFLEDDEGYLWVSTRGSGLLKYDQHNKLIRQYKHEPSDSFSMIGNNAGALFQNEKNTIWVGTDIGLRVFDKVTQKFSRFPEHGNVKNFPDSGITHIRQDNRGLFWFSGWGNGLVCYNPKDHSIKRFLSDKEDSFSISSNEVGGMLDDEPGVLWTGGSSGINRLDLKTERFKNYLPKIWGIQLFRDSEGNIWTGNQNGLFRYNSKEDQFSVFFDSQREINGFIFGGIVEDDAKNLWIPSQLGIVKLNLLTKEIFIYGSKYGIDPRSLVLWAKTYKNRKGQIFVPRENGFYTFSPEELAVNPDFPIIITDFFINSVPVLPGNGSPLQRPVEGFTDLVLKHTQNNLAFNFAAIDYREPDAIKYFYILEGYDLKWREAKDKSCQYLRLPPDNYIFRIKAINAEGTTAEKTITIRINPAWWNTWLFRIAAIIVLVSSSYALMRWRIRQKFKLQLERLEKERQMSELKQKGTELEMQALRAQMNPHFIFNSLNSINR
ncbi:MAG TPA: two-component regulator propeller domain-containing protein, partial [Chitinophagaceae bacterium]|nr:two-component regulator propeller domain-containing protein [Chitinophagaceae bacterium]